MIRPPPFFEEAKGWARLHTVHRGQHKGRLFELKNEGLEVRSGSNFKILGLRNMVGKGVIKGIWEISLGVGLFKEATKGKIN